MESVWDKIASEHRIEIKSESETLQLFSSPERRTTYQLKIAFRGYVINILSSYTRRDYHDNGLTRFMFDLKDNCNFKLVVRRRDFLDKLSSIFYSNIFTSAHPEFDKFYTIDCSDKRIRENFIRDKGLITKWMHLDNKILKVEEVATTNQIILETTTILTKKEKVYQYIDLLISCIENIKRPL